MTPPCNIQNNASRPHNDCFYSACPHEHHPTDEGVEQAHGVHSERLARGHKHVSQEAGRGARAPAAADDDAGGAQHEAGFACE